MKERSRDVHRFCGGCSRGWQVLPTGCFGSAPTAPPAPLRPPRLPFFLRLAVPFPASSCMVSTPSSARTRTTGLLLKNWARDVMEEDFSRLKQAFKAKYSAVRVPELDPPLKIAVLVSWKDPCLVYLLHMWQEGRIPVRILCIISNHVREENTHVIRLLRRHDIPYHFVPASKENRQEDKLLSLVADSDFLLHAGDSHKPCLQILSPEFLKAYGRDIINIHHGLLPSFKGANPYKQAHEAGVKLIGATSHFVTEELDGGPFIEQMVERVSHRDLLDSFAMKSEYLEKACLVKAVKYYCELRIIQYDGKKTIVFD